jgi:hypothetical protein
MALSFPGLHASKIDSAPAHTASMSYKHHITRVARHAHRPGLGLFMLLVLGLLQAAYAEDKSVYSTKDDIVTTQTSATDANGNTTTVTTNQNEKTNTYLPSEYDNRMNAWKNDPNAKNFPYDSTGGANRSDVDTARQGFDDPRNPWDGRYSNDNPANHPAGSAYDRGEPTHNYRPGDFGTQSVGGGGRRGRN